VVISNGKAGRKQPLLKKRRKIFCTLGRGVVADVAHDPDYQSFFASFCSQKEDFLLFLGQEKISDAPLGN
jgi:hypothetical protein